MNNFMSPCVCTTFHFSPQICKSFPYLFVWTVFICSGFFLTFVFIFKSTCENENKCPNYKNLSKYLRRNNIAWSNKQYFHFTLKNNGNIFWWVCMCTLFILKNGRVWPKNTIIGSLGYILYLWGKGNWVEKNLLKKLLLWNVLDKLYVHKSPLHKVWH